jgi:hypothetical protein
MVVMLKIIIFVLATIGITWVSRLSLQNVQAHGFYRFFAWETILISFLINMNYWFVVISDRFSDIHLSRCSIVSQAGEIGPGTQ